jgi:hypothetical protein
VRVGVDEARQQLRAAKTDRLVGGVVATDGSDSLAVDQDRRTLAANDGVPEEHTQAAAATELSAYRFHGSSS